MTIESGEPKEIYYKFEIYDHNDLMKMFKIERTTLFKMIKAGVLPVVKGGKGYYTTSKLLDEWFEKMKGKEILY